MARRKAPQPKVRRFEVPFTAEVGRLVNGAIGIRSVVQRAGAYAPYRMDVTVLDAPDHRLIRAGIWLAHRVLDGRGEWYLAAPQWSPWLPQEQVELMGHADVPDTFADLLRPFRRGAALGPVAALRCRRSEYLLRGEAGAVLAAIRNEQVTVRSGGIVTARYREVTITSVDDALTPAQWAFLGEVLAAAGATRVTEFPDLAQRLGAPATGLADIRRRPGGERPDVLEEYVQDLVARRLRRITHADLALRGGLEGAAGQLRGHLVRLRSDLHGLVPLLDRTWATETEADLDAAISGLDDHPGPGVPPALNSQRYLFLLDHLVTASRAPRLGDHAARPAAEALGEILAEGVADLCAVMDHISADSRDEVWKLAHDAAARVVATCGVQPDRTKAVRRLARRADTLTAMLTACVQVNEDEHVRDLECMGPQEAFELGRSFERAWSEQHIARLDAVDHWERRGDRLRGPRREAR
ncbi:hypothetical protein GCM10027418_05010 [Mariniluteicoccus endophyticus]